MIRFIKNLLATLILVTLSYLSILALIVFIERLRVSDYPKFSIKSLTTDQKLDVVAKTDYFTLQPSSFRPPPSSSSSSLLSSTSLPPQPPSRAVNTTVNGTSRNTVIERSLNELTGGQTCAKLTRPRPDDVKFRHDHWQLLTGDQDTEVLFYTAFFDDRPIVGFPPWIRILGVVKVISFSDPRLFCHVWYAQSDVPYVVDVESIQTGRDHDIVGNLKYGQRLYSCRLPSHVSWIPTHVSVAVERCAKSLLLLPVQLSAPQTSLPNSVRWSSSLSSSNRWQHQFVVCVEQLFGSFPPEVIAEWIETYRIFGVTSFNLYNGNVTDSNTIRIIEYYANRGVVDWRPLPPSVDDYSEEGVRLSSPASLNDCMMRHMYTSRFIVVVDIDEIIVPRIHANYTAMMSHIDRSLGLTTSYHTYSFRNAYFFRYFPGDAAQPPYLRTMRLRHRAPPSEYLFHAKSFVDPRQCLSVYNHYCWIQFPDEKRPESKSLGTSVDVDPKIALSHHYRYRCSDPDEMCVQYDTLKTIDDVMLQYRDVLTSRVQQVLKDAGLFRR